MRAQTTTSELRIPADPAYIVVAKRAASGFAYLAGFGVEAIDELGIAISQACENAIRCVSGTGSAGQLRLTFALEDGRLTIQVASSCARTAVTAEPADAGADSRARQVARERAQAARHGVPSQPAAAVPSSDELALRVMGLFVDDCRYRVDERTGGLRVRLTKYRVS